MNPFQSTRRILIPAFAALLAPLAFSQGTLNVALCGAASTTNTACQWTTVQTALLATNQFATVDIINVTTTGTGTPTLQQLQQYDALLCWTNNTPADNNAWGDVLADYVDAGGVVVVAVFANSSLTTGRNIGGRWQTGYEVVLDQSGSASGAASLGTVAQPAHPIMAGVTTFVGGSIGSRPVGTALEAGASLIASWSDGKVLVAEGANPRRVDLGFYPPPSTCSGSGWTTGGDLLMANALAYVAGGASCPAPVAYCTAGTTTNGCVSTMSATGTATAGAASGFTLTASNVEGQKSGLIFYGINGPQAAQWGTGSSFLCVKAPTQRLPSQLTGGTAGACDGSLSNDFLAFLSANPTALGAPGTAGQTFHAQAWFRDPPAPKTTNLSDGLEFVLCP